MTEKFAKYVVILVNEDIFDVPLLTAEADFDASTSNS